jgi:protein SCO1/2
MVLLLYQFTNSTHLSPGLLAQSAPPPRVDPATLLPEALKDIGIDQRLGERLPLDVVVQDEQGRSVRLGDYFGQRPVVLTLVYYECPMLCTQVLNGLLTALRVLSFTPGKEFDIVTLSFDPSERPALAAAKKAEYLEDYARPDAAAGWHFLTGDASSIAAVAKAAGFRYRRDQKTDLFIHASGLMVATPDGTLARYFYGIDYSARDLRLALVEASNGRIASPIDRVLLFCFHYDPALGRYSVLTLNLVRAGGVITVVALVAFVVVSRRREPRTRTENLGT